MCLFPGHSDYTLRATVQNPFPRVPDAYGKPNPQPGNFVKTMLDDNRHSAAKILEFQSHRLPLAILLFIAFWSYFYANGSVEIDLMEARNLVAAREILQSDDWLIPTMNGEIRISKPPLPTWFAALTSQSAGGTDELSLLRLPSAIAALLMVLITYGLAWTMSRDRAVAFMAAAILASNIMVMKMGHRASWDIFCHVFMLGALWAYMLGMLGNRGWPVFALLGGLMGLSFLSKGPVSFYALLLPFLLGYLCIYRLDPLRQKWRLLLLAVGVAAVISSLWPLYILNFHPEALLSTVLQESNAWANRHTQPFWYYLDFPVYGGLWLVVAIAALIEPFARKRVKSIQQYRFLLLWLVFGILLLSVIPEKKHRYLLPAMIPMALLCATLLRGIMLRYYQGMQERGDRVVVILHMGLGAVFGGACLGFFFYHLRIVDQRVPLIVFVPVIAGFLLLLVANWICFRRKNLAGLFVLTLLQYCLIIFLYMNYYRDVNITNPDFKSMGQVDSTQLPPETEIFQLESWLDIIQVWDLKRRVNRWQTEEVLSLLDNGNTIAVISTGDPRGQLAALIDRKIIVTTIDWFDYNEKRPARNKTYLSLVNLAE
jgi:4-amino-4-deoxy-L-arabinose transferase-like glycosyltransferase